MIKHNFLLFIRSIRKNTHSFLINIIGLSAALICVILIALWVNDELKTDQFHEHADLIYHLMERNEKSTGIEILENTAGHAGDLVKAEMPEIELVTMVAEYANNSTLTVDDKSIKADGQYVGKDFFNIFSYPLLEGNTASIWSNKESIIISEALAIKLFGSTENLIGKQIEFQKKQIFTISGIFEDLPTRSSQQFDFVLSFEELREVEEHLRSWGSTSTLTYFKMKPNTDIDAFNDKLGMYIANVTNNRILHSKYFVAKYADKYLHGQYENGFQTGGRIVYVRLFSMVALFILLIACINFMNLSTAQASRRFKEIGVKKAAGASRKLLIFQHLFESVSTALAAILIAVIVVALFLPQFNQITSKDLILPFNAFTLLSLGGIAVFTGLLAGSYPAFYLSGFDPVEVLKGRLKNLGSASQIRRGLVIFQYSISIILIVVVFVVYKQIQFIQTQNLGYTKDQMIHFDREGKTLNDQNLDAFLQEIENIPGVVNASSTRNSMVGQPWGVSGMQWEGQAPDDNTSFQNMIAYYDLLEMMEIQLKEGRAFSRDFTNEDAKVIFNEAAIEHMGLQDPVGKTVNFRGVEREIIGVVKDFHYKSFRQSIKPMVINLWPHRLTKIMVQLESGKEQQTLESLSAFLCNIQS